MRKQEIAAGELRNENQRVYISQNLYLRITIDSRTIKLDKTGTVPGATALSTSKIGCLKQDVMFWTAVSPISNDRLMLILDG